MKRKWVLLSLTVSVISVSFIVTRASADEKISAAAQAEREKALKNPYPNDLGPGTVDIAKYPPELKEGYDLMQVRCAKCHTPSRPLNSQFLQLSDQEAAELKQKQPEIFKDKLVWQVESSVWQRYIKRMMAKPGCDIPDQVGRKIYKFMVYDSKFRKTGANAEKWEAHRKELLSQFKTKYPARYKELFETQ